MSIQTYGNDQNFHKVLKVEVIDGGLEGLKRLIIHQLVETIITSSLTMGSS